MKAFSSFMMVHEYEFCPFIVITDTGVLGQISNLFLHNHPIFEAYVLHKGVD